jgi:soluble lytic murein transglycosylase-like protein
MNKPRQEDRSVWLLIASLVAAFLFLLPRAVAGCWEEAAAPYGHDPLLMKSVAWLESRGHEKAVGPSLRDGNKAVGVMQINTIHLPALKAFGITLDMLFDACTNIKVGAWVLADCRRRFGDTWRAVGCYYAGPHSRAFSAMEVYVQQVQKYYEGYLRDAIAERASRNTETE